MRLKPAGRRAPARVRTCQTYTHICIYDCIHIYTSYIYTNEINPGRERRFPGHRKIIISPSITRKARPRQDLLPRISVRENNPLTARTIQKHDVRENNPPTTPGATPAIPGQSEIDHRGNSTNHPNPDHISINNQHCRKSSANHLDHSETPPSCPGGVILRPERRFPGHPEFIISPTMVARKSSSPHVFDRK